MPLLQIDPKSWNYISNVRLADETYHTPSEIDILVGAEFYSKIMLSGRLSGLENKPIAYETVFGWVLLGRTEDIYHGALEPHSFCAITELPLESILKKF